MLKWGERLQGLDRGQKMSNMRDRGGDNWTYDGDMCTRDPSRIFEYSDIRIIQGEYEYEFLKSNIRIVKFVKKLIN